MTAVARDQWPGPFGWGLWASGQAFGTTTQVNSAISERQLNSSKIAACEVIFSKYGRLLSELSTNYAGLWELVHKNGLLFLILRQKATCFHLNQIHLNNVSPKLSNERYGINSRLTIVMPVSFSYVDSWALPGTYTTGDNSNYVEADHLTGQGQHEDGHLGTYVLVLLLPGLYTRVSVLGTVEKISATGFCQIAMKNEICGKTSRRKIQTGN